MRRILILGAGFGGLELSTILSEALGEDAGVTLIDKNDSFAFGYSKLDVMFGRVTADEVCLPYADFVKPGVRLLRENVIAIDPHARRVTTNSGVHEADVLVVALGADYDFDATPGLGGENEFYSMAGAERMRDVLPSFTAGHALVGVCGAPFKCPPAPSEAALLLHDYLVTRGVRDACRISLVMPLGTPVPPSPDTSAALLEAFAERDIDFVGGRRITSLAGNIAFLDDGTEIPYDLFLGVPKHRAPDVLIESGMTTDGYITADSQTLESGFPGVYAIGDVATAGVPKSGSFAEGAARVVASALLGHPEPHKGQGVCYIEFGAGRIGRSDIDFLTGPKPRGDYQGVSEAFVAEKELFGSSRRSRWFGRD